MTKKEFAILTSAIRTYYPRENILPNEQAMELWYDELKDIPYNAAQLAIKAWVSKSKWSPSIADIREEVGSFTRENTRTVGEAWGDVLRAVKRFGRYCEAEALDTMDDLTAKVVKQIGFDNICNSENIANERSSFLKIYQIEEKREKERAQMPDKLLAAIDTMLLEAEDDKE